MDHIFLYTIPDHITSQSMFDVILALAARLYFAHVHNQERQMSSMGFMKYMFLSFFSKWIRIEVKLPFNELMSSVGFYIYIMDSMPPTERDIPPTCNQWNRYNIMA